MKIKNQILLSALLVLLFGTVNIVHAETILLENEDVFQGTITNYSNESISVDTESGPKEIPLSEIHLIDYLGSVKDYQKEFNQPNLFIIYLKNGEILEGMITQFSNDFITVESASGHGVLQLPTQSVNYVTSKNIRVKMDQRNGIGYVQKKSTLNLSSGMTSYVSDQISYKMFFDDELFGNILLAHGDATYGADHLRIFSLDYRMGLIFDQIQNINLYYGGSIGYLQVRDDKNGIDGAGNTLSIFMGAELFFDSLPNFGFSGELGFRYQKAGEYSSTDLSISSFPSFSIHYYY
jgi:hypothetical protein